MNVHKIVARSKAIYSNDSNAILLPARSRQKWGIGVKKPSRGRSASAGNPQKLYLNDSWTVRPGAADVTCPKLIESTDVAGASKLA